MDLTPHGLQTWRANGSISCADAAKIFGVSPVTYRNYEAGLTRIRPPRADALRSYLAAAVIAAPNSPQHVRAVASAGSAARVSEGMAGSVQHDRPWCRGVSGHSGRTLALVCVRRGAVAA